MKPCDNQFVEKWKKKRCRFGKCGIKISLWHFKRSQIRKKLTCWTGAATALLFFIIFAMSNLFRMAKIDLQIYKIQSTPANLSVRLTFWHRYEMKEIHLNFSRSISVSLFNTSPFNISKNSRNVYAYFVLLCETFWDFKIFPNFFLLSTNHATWQLRSV